MERPALQNERVGVFWMAFRARKVFRTFEKQTPGHHSNHAKCSLPGTQQHKTEKQECVETE